MKILVICGGGYVSGKEKVMLSLIKGLKADSHDVHCIISDWSNGNFEQLMLKDSIIYRKMPLGFISKKPDWKAVKMTATQFIYWPKLLHEYKNYISKFAPEVVIHSNFHHLFLLLPVIRHKKYINIYHSHESVIDTSMHRKLFKRFDRKIALFVGVSEYVSKKMADLGIKNDKIKTIYNGIEDSVAIRNSWRKDSFFNIGISGQVVPWKGHEDLVEALYFLKREKPFLDFRLYIFGDGPDYFNTRLKYLINQKGLNNHVFWKGFVHDINDIYQFLDVLCFPSRSEEPLGLSVLEAGLFSLPVIVSNRGGLPEIIKDNVNGLLVEAFSPVEIASKLAYLSENPDVAKLMGEKHRSTVLKKFTFNKFIEYWNYSISMAKKAFDSIKSIG